MAETATMPVIEEAKIQTIALDTLTIDPRLQHRDDAKAHKGAANPERVKLYEKLVNDGAEFPPPKVVKEGKVLWVYGGFHTIAAHMRAKVEKLKIEVRKGTFADALFLSLAENVGPAARTEATQQTVIQIALQTHPEMSNVQIGRHVGVHSETVRRARIELEKLEKERRKAEKEAEKARKAEEKRLRDEAIARGETPPEPAPAPETSSAPAEDVKDEEEKPKTRTVTRGGKTYEMNVGNLGKKGGKGGKAEKNGHSDKAEPAEKKGYKDRLGNVVPTVLDDVFGSSLPEDITDTLNEVLPIIDQTEKWWPWLDRLAVKEKINEAIAMIRAAMPFALCPKCNGEKPFCESCQHSGYLTESAHSEVTTEMAKLAPSE